MQELQQAELALGPQLLVATPGRLRDLLAQQVLGLGALRCLVLDEADRLLEMGFWPDIQWLIKAMPAERQTLLFSATPARRAGELGHRPVAGSGAYRGRASTAW